MRGWAVFAILLSLPAFAGCMGEAAIQDEPLGFEARYERVDQKGDPVWMSGIDITLSSALAKDREGVARPAYRLTSRAVDDTGLGLTEVLDGAWRVVRHDQETVEGARYTTDPNLRLTWLDGTMVSPTGIGWVQSLRHLPTVPVGSNGAVDVFRDSDEVQIRIHYPRSQEIGGSQLRVATYHYEPGELLPHRIVTRDMTGQEQVRVLTRFEATEPLGSVSPWPESSPEQFAPVKDGALFADMDADPLRLGYTHQDVLDYLITEDSDASDFVRRGCLLHYSVRLDLARTVASPNLPVLFTRTLGAVHEAGFGGQQDDTARWTAQHYDDEFGNETGFVLQRSGFPAGASLCDSVEEVRPPELTLGKFIKLLHSDLAAGQLRILNVFVADPFDAARPASTGWTHYTATFDAGPSQPVVWVRMDAHQQWWESAIVLGGDPSAFDLA